jgi:hypothetical protein
VRRDGELVFPMTVAQFLRHADTLLMRSDVVLSRSRTLSSWLIRFGTGGFFSHAALVFLVPKPEDGFYNTFLLESVSSGVGLANLRDYLDRRHGHNDLVIRRLDAPWFDDRMRTQVRGLMLDHVKASYDYGRVFRIALSVLFGLQLGWSRVARGGKASMEDAVKKTHHRKARWVPPQFICSGFVQYGFAKAAMRARKSVRRVLFRDGLEPSDMSGILAVTPEDIATTDKLDWLYAITGGLVHRVTSYDEAKRIIVAGRR